eukprot:TRINITY_DN3314_c1_g1_i1.p1 TRINITY_DN3314_c1_g1~~TRINITY_DN3314_c1_g1_i1.p1  ORF type:complete len:298 (+),score=84.25 TRINITY_DN3314_c1_g1_i1:1203-2096(+)
MFDNFPYLSAFLPELRKENYKGQQKLLIVGGSEEYAGAPTFAGITALNSNVDLVCLLCHEKASNAIKSFDPDLIVYPYLPQYEKKIDLSRMDACVIGCGLSTNPKMLEVATEIIRECVEKDIYCVVDGDAIRCLPSIIECLNYPKLIVTPNFSEASFLFKQLLDVDLPSPNKQKEPINMIDYYVMMKDFKCHFVFKGMEDFVISGTEYSIIDEEGSLRRCGGQGDILAGFIGSAMSWLHKEQISTKEMSGLLADCCSYIRKLAKAGFKVFDRTLTAGKLLTLLEEHFLHECYGDDDA